MLCLTVCVIPAFANNVDAVIYPDQGYCYFARSGVEDTSILNPMLDLSATFQYSSDNVTNDQGSSAILFRGPDISLDNSNGDLVAIYPYNSYFEIIFPLGEPGQLAISGDALSTTENYLVPPVFYPYQYFSGFRFKVDVLVDDVIVYSSNVMNKPLNFSGISYSGSAENHFSIRYSLVADSLAPDVSYVVAHMNTSGPYFLSFTLPYDIFTFNGQSVPVDNLEVVIGKLEDISGKLDVIQSSTVSIDNNLSEIKNGLQDSNSSIWGAFKDSVSGLFVPSADDLTGVKDGFDQLAQDKLGGAYQTVDMVSGGVQSVTDKFKNPVSSPGVEFPGISVPLGGDVGTVTLAASQTVTIPEQVSEVLYPVAGIIIPIVCTIWTVRLGLDMVNCFMSGMSYGDFLHRHTDEEDNEV